MARRGRRKKFKLKLSIRPDTVRSVVALGFIMVGALSLISFFVPSYTINSHIQKLLRGLFGLPSIIIPFLFIGSGLLFVDALKHKLKEPRILIGLFFLLFSLSGLFHIFLSGDIASEYAEAGKGGGLVGYKLASLLKSTVSIYGGVLVLAVGLLMAVVVASDVSLDRILTVLAKRTGGVSWSKIFQLLREAVRREDSGNVEVASGMNVPVASDSLEVEVSSMEPVSDADMDEAVDVEIIPTLSEPQAGTPPQADISSGVIKGGEPALPYADRVWEYPPSDLLDDTPISKGDSGDTEERTRILVRTLKDFNIDVDVKSVKCGPSVTQYALKAESGVKVSKIAGLHTNLAMAVASPTGSVRIEAPIPGKSLIGIEVPNTRRAVVDFKSLISSEAMKGMKSKLGIVLGKDVGGMVHAYSIARMPHLLVAGATGSGKSVFIHNIIFSILYRATAQEVKFILIDPKRVELQHYQDMPHLLTPVVTDTEKAASVFRWAVAEMNRRYQLLEKAKAKNIEVYNEKSGFQAMSYIVMVVDELAEIMITDPAGVEKSIIRLAQLARAVGIHLVLAVQRPSTNIITGLIKANIPCRVAFNVTSQIDSRVIIDQPGAEKLLGKGDMLFVPPDAAKPVRLQCALVSDREIDRVVEFLINRNGKAVYNQEVLTMCEATKKSTSSWGDEVDELFDDAIEVVTMAGKASASLLQRKLSVGYARAARILDELESKGVVGPSQGSRPRTVLLDTTPTPKFDLREAEAVATNDLDNSVVSDSPDSIDSIT